MSYAPPAPVAAPRPVTVSLAAALLALMALAGLGYAVVTLVVTPGVVSRFRGLVAGAEPQFVDGLVTAVWVGAGIATALGIILFALYAVLALGLRRGSPAARIGTWVVCAFGLLAGCGSAIAVAVQRTGAAGSDGVPAGLATAYPDGWIELNVGLSIAQVVGYLLVAVLVAVSPRAFFRRGGPPDGTAQHQGQLHQPFLGQPPFLGQQPFSGQPFGGPPSGYPHQPGTFYALPVTAAEPSGTAAGTGFTAPGAGWCGRPT